MRISSLPSSLVGVARCRRAFEKSASPTFTTSSFLRGKAWTRRPRQSVPTGTASCCDHSERAPTGVIVTFWRSRVRARVEKDHAMIDGEFSDGAIGHKANNRFHYISGHNVQARGDAAQQSRISRRFFSLRRVSFSVRESFESAPTSREAKVTESSSAECQELYFSS